MPSTAEAVVIFALAILPGALYIWAFEREAGRWGIGLSDRIFRFVAASAVFQLLFAAAAGLVANQLTYQRLLFRQADDGPLSAELRLVSGWKLLGAAA